MEVSWRKLRLIGIFFFITIVEWSQLFGPVEGSMRTGKVGDEDDMMLNIR